MSVSGSSSGSSSSPPSASLSSQSSSSSHASSAGAEGFFSTATNLVSCDVASGRKCEWREGPKTLQYAQAWQTTRTHCCMQSRQGGSSNSNNNKNHKDNDDDDDNKTCNGQTCGIRPGATPSKIHCKGTRQNSKHCSHAVSWAVSAQRSLFPRGVVTGALNPACTDAAPRFFEPIGAMAVLALNKESDNCPLAVHVAGFAAMLALRSTNAVPGERTRSWVWTPCLYIHGCIASEGCQAFRCSSMQHARRSTSTSAASEALGAAGRTQRTSDCTADFCEATIRGTNHEVSCHHGAFGFR